METSCQPLTIGYWFSGIGFIKCEALLVIDNLNRMMNK